MAMVEKGPPRHDAVCSIAPRQGIAWWPPRGHLLPAGPTPLPTPSGTPAPGRRHRCRGGGCLRTTVHHGALAPGDAASSAPGWQRNLGSRHQPPPPPTPLIPPKQRLCNGGGLPWPLRRGEGRRSGLSLLASAPPRTCITRYRGGRGAETVGRAGGRRLITAPWSPSSRAHPRQRRLPTTHDR